LRTATSSFLGTPSSSSLILVVWVADHRIGAMVLPTTISFMILMNQVHLFFLGLEPEHHLFAHDVKVNLSCPDIDLGLGVS
jgi:hypothetical protein